MTDVVIIGAGPYGLSAAAHLRAADRVSVRVFGEPMSFWDRQMPIGMLLRSPWAASHLSDPKDQLTLDAYRAADRNHFAAPIPLDRFVEYGRWFQRRAVPDVDRRHVTFLERVSGAFRLTLDDGQIVQARRVVVAAGIAPFSWQPEPFNNVSSSLVSHASEQRDLQRFAGLEVAVIGAGQSALESAALLHEAGAKVRLFVRGAAVRWLKRRLHKWPIEPLLYAPADVGPALVSHVVARPHWFRRLPHDWQQRLGPRSIRAAGAKWLMPRLSDVPIVTSRRVITAIPSCGRVELALDDGSETMVDHVLLGTGYRVDIAHYKFLDQKLLANIRQVDGFPELDEGFECSVGNLHFLGAPAAWSFGPLMRFVVGAKFASSALARRVNGTR